MQILNVQSWTRRYRSDLSRHAPALPALSAMCRRLARNCFAMRCLVESMLLLDIRTAAGCYTPAACLTPTLTARPAAAEGGAGFSLAGELGARLGAEGGAVAAAGGGVDAPGHLLQPPQGECRGPEGRPAPSLGPCCRVASRLSSFNLPRVSVVASRVALPVREVYVVVWLLSRNPGT